MQMQHRKHEFSFVYGVAAIMASILAHEGTEQCAQNCAESLLRQPQVARAKGHADSVTMQAWKSLTVQAWTSCCRALASVLGNPTVQMALRNACWMTCCM